MKNRSSDPSEWMPLREYDIKVSDDFELVYFENRINGARAQEYSIRDSQVIIRMDFNADSAQLDPRNIANPTTSLSLPVNSGVEEDLDAVIVDTINYAIIGTSDFRDFRLAGQVNVFGLISGEWSLEGETGISGQVGILAFRGLSFSNPPANDFYYNRVRDTPA